MDRIPEHTLFEKSMIPTPERKGTEAIARKGRHNKVSRRRQARVPVVIRRIGYLLYLYVKEMAKEKAQINQCGVPELMGP